MNITINNGTKKVCITINGEDLDIDIITNHTKEDINNMEDECIMSSNNTEETIKVNLPIQTYRTVNLNKKKFSDYLKS